jgi:hypothetical protein
MRSQSSVLQRHSDSICGNQLAHVTREQFMSPSSTVAVRLRARRTLDLIAAHRVSLEPVCASRSGLDRASR